MSFDLSLINNDLSITADKKLRTVSDTPKLRQDILKIILTPLGSMKLHLWYGCSINDDIIGKNLSDLYQLSKVRYSISSSLDRLKALQISQSSNQKVSLAELIASVGGIDVERDLDEPRQVNVMVTIFSKRLAKIDELFTIIG